MADEQTGREVHALPGPAVAELRAASVGTTATLTAALQRWAQGQPRRGTVPADGAAAVAALGQQVGPLLAMHLPRAEALATEHMRRQLGAVTSAAPPPADTAAIGEHLAGRAREILSAELTRAYLHGLEGFDPAAVAQQVVRRVVAAAVQTIRTELMRAYNATARALLDAVGWWRRWDARLDTACARCDALDGQIAEPGRPFFLEGAPVGDPPLHPYCQCKLEGIESPWASSLAMARPPGASFRIRDIPALMAEIGRVLEENPGLEDWLSQPRSYGDGEAFSTTLRVVHRLRANGAELDGMYVPQTNTIFVRREQTFPGGVYYPGVASGSSGAASAEETACRTWAHEVGEAIFVHMPPARRVEVLRLRGYVRSSGDRLTRYGDQPGQNNEWFAEAMSLLLTSPGDLDLAIGSDSVEELRAILRRMGVLR